MILRYTVKDADSGRTVYAIMRRELRISAALTRRLKQAGAIYAGGVPVYTDHAVAAGETVEIDIMAAEPPCDLVPEAGPLDILFEDSGLIAVSKPAGVLTHPSRARYTGTLSNFVAGYLAQSTGSGCCHAVNRLDRDTSGVVLFAKNSYMKALASEALAEPDAIKEYTAAVFGVMEPPAGTIDLPIRRLREMDMRRTVSPDGQRAVTHYKTELVLKTAGGALSLLRLTLETGRTHQIRVHCRHLGHPVLGDILYYTAESAALSKRLGAASQLLHARRLSFSHPLTGRRIDLEALEPELFCRIRGGSG
jgi:23S rRNA pseudouridine1911/1915/1917 synthase